MFRCSERSQPHNSSQRTGATQRQLRNDPWFGVEMALQQGDLSDGEGVHSRRFGRLVWLPAGPVAAAAGAGLQFVADRELDFPRTDHDLTLRPRLAQRQIGVGQEHLQRQQ
ncbi:MAG: hypothetical protein ACK5Q5_12155, partial [Planctomycetaceae bacterium]